MAEQAKAGAVVQRSGEEEVMKMKKCHCEAAKPTKQFDEIATSR